VPVIEGSCQYAEQGEGSQRPRAGPDWGCSSRNLGPGGRLVAEKRLGQPRVLAGRHPQTSLSPTWLS
jgi:hypothetical protein